MRGLVRRRGTPSRGHWQRGLTGRPSRERRRRRPTATPLVALPSLGETAEVNGEDVAGEAGGSVCGGRRCRGGGSVAG